MLKKIKVKAIYMYKGICDKCGGELVPTGICLDYFPSQYSYRCINCESRELFSQLNLPGKIEYELEEEEDV